MTINQKRLEYQLYLARESPESKFDVSKCDLIKIPQGCYTLCKVLRKKVLCINDNKIKDLTSNGNMIEDLTVLAEIHAGSNEISRLPDNISSIQYLQVLDVSHNQLKSLPDSIGDLLYLKKLYLQYNNISFLPSTMLTDKSSLELIDICENKEFIRIPPAILNLQKLRHFSYTLQYLKYPTLEICNRGVLEILKVLCQDTGISMSRSIIDRFTGDIGCDDVDCSLVDASRLDYESFKQNRLSFLLSIENQLHNTMSNEDSLMTKATKDKIEFLNNIANEEIRITNEIAKLHKERDLRREQLINNVRVAEADAKNLVEEIITVNKACHQQERILDELEKDTMKKYQVYQEDFNRLRKEEMLNIMSQMLASQHTADNIFQNQLSSKEELMDKITGSKSLTDESINEILKDRRNKQDQLLNAIEIQENQQKIAFQHLQLEKDVRTLRIKQQILSVESELMILSQVEQNKRTEKSVFERRILNERRADLVRILGLLMEEKKIREKDLFNNLMEIERHRKNDQADFWLVQYQRLLDMKPDTLLDQASTLDGLVLEAVARANAKEYLPFFQRRNVTWEQLEHFQKKDLINIGIHDMDKIRDILYYVSQIAQELEKNSVSLKQPKNVTSISLPKAFTPSSRAPTVLDSHKESECCICLDHETTMLFLECGHICCCEKCSKNLNECPLCRQSISRLIKLMAV